MSDRPLRLHGRLLPSGERVELFVADGRLTFSPVAGAETIVVDAWLVPGLVDAHAHLALASPAPDDADDVEVVRASARAQLEAGVLAVREPGSPNRASLGVGPHVGLPRVHTGGRFLAAPGGYFPGMAREVPPEGLAAAAADEARASGHWAKIVLDFVDHRGRLSPTVEAWALQDAVAAVHEAGGRLAVHAMTAGAIEMAIAAGVDSIEHATEMRADWLPALVAKGIVLVPTLLIREPIVATVRSMGLPDSEERRWRDAVDGQAAVVARAAQAGVRILAGTDAGMVDHGLVMDEIAALIDAGVDGTLALGAGSWAAREFLGLPGLEEGAPADIVAFAGDPRVPRRSGPPVARVLDGRLLVG
jgi:imidazolonepropionase-like amidohydrolase